MTRKEVERAERIAKEFLEAVSDLWEDMESPFASGLSGSKESGAVRRKSMDLTRALARMRNRR